MIPGNEALQKLKNGNARFLSGEISRDLTADKLNLDRMARGQEPFAVVLGCSDSRVPAEMLFGQGFGDLFVVRVAGNVASWTQLGSIEFAVQQLGVRLVVVLGHSGCGAVGVTLKEMENPSAGLSPNLAALVDRIKPALDGLKEKDRSDTKLTRAVHLNTLAAMNRLVADSEIIARFVAEDGLLVMGGQYSLDTGKVVFFSADDQEETFSE